MENIEKEIAWLIKEIKWRYKNTDYTDDDKFQVVIHETIDKEVSFISEHQVEELINELGVSLWLKVVKDYKDEFGSVPTVRQTLYLYFEVEIMNRLDFGKKL